MNDQTAHPMNDSLETHLMRAMHELNLALDHADALHQLHAENITIARDLIWGARRENNPTLKD